MVQLSILNTLLVLYSLIASHPAIAVTEDQIRTFLLTRDSRSEVANTGRRLFNTEC